MKKVFFICVASVGLILASCGGEDKKSSESAKSTPEASGKGQNAEPQTACDCVKNVNNELNQLLKMSVQEIQKNPQVGEEFKLKIDKMLNKGKCQDLMRNFKKEYATPKAFMEACPEMIEMLETTQQLQNMGVLEVNEMDTTDF
ncbi:MAG: hypothetical protein FJX99_03565 [Bacteroidetes bacterium]|nr:hypothetical protein [Bacteroidota bacterium]